MIIHVVQPGETIYSISAYYGLPVNSIIQENGITNPGDLVVGQTIVIVYPQIIYTVQEGDTLEDIAYKYGTNLFQLLRNNPHLSEQEFIYPGETIIISYYTEKISTITTNGFAYPFIDKDILRKTLPFLSYLTIFHYRVMLNGDLIDLDDSELIQLAKEYDVAPMMLISTLSDQGIGSKEVATNILNNMDVQERFVDNVVSMLKTKGYYGLNIYIQFLIPENRTLVEQFLQRFTKRIHEEGFRVVVTVTPKVNYELTNVEYEKIDYSSIAQMVDKILFVSYEWGYSYGPPASVAPVNLIREILNYIVTTVPPEKVSIGLSIVGYDWPLPYIPGFTRANAITTEAAIEIAREEGVSIQFDIISQAPYFFYISSDQKYHIVWFKDARNVDVITRLLPEYGFTGLSIWNINHFFTQMWLIINVNYDIEKVL